MQKFRLVSSIIAFLLIAIVMGFGVYAALTDTVNISNKVIIETSTGAKFTMTGSIKSGKRNNLEELTGSNAKFTTTNNNSSMNLTLSQWIMPDFVFTDGEDSVSLFELTLVFKQENEQAFNVGINGIQGDTQSPARFSVIASGEDGTWTPPTGRALAPATDDWTGEFYMVVNSEDEHIVTIIWELENFGRTINSIAQYISISITDVEQSE